MTIGRYASSLAEALQSDDWQVETYESCEAFLEAYRPERRGCLLIDAYLPDMDGFDLLRQLHDKGDTLPAIMITGNSDVAMAVRAMKAGVSDFIEKPIAEGGALRQHPARAGACR